VSSFWGSLQNGDFFYQQRNTTCATDLLTFFAMDTNTSFWNRSFLPSAKSA